MMIPELGHLPPGTPALLLIIGGLALAVPAAVGILLRPAPARGSESEQAARAVLVLPRPVGEAPLPPKGLTLIDQALERVHLAGFGDARILQSEARRKLVRVFGCSCAARGHTCEGTRAALAEAVREALGREPQVEEAVCEEGRCEFVVAY